MKHLLKILDFYLAAPILIDLIICTLIWLISFYCPLFQVVANDRNNQLSLLSNITGTQISLAGFILAALTIIVTFKSNLKAKGIEHADNALDLIFSSVHYYKIVRVFKLGIIELTLNSFAIYVVWSMMDSLKTEDIFRFNVLCIGITSLTILRSLSVLFITLGLDNHKEEI